MRLAWIGITTLAVIAPRASADPLPPLLSWRAPAGCPDEAELRGRIAERAGRARADGAEPYAIVDVSADAAGFVARVHVRAGGTLDERLVHGASCADVADAVAWVVALAWGPAREEAVAPPATASTAIAARAPAPPGPPWAIAHVAAELAGGAGVVPGLDGGVGVALGARHGAVELELAGAWWPHRLAPVAPGSRDGVEVGLAAIAARVCVAPWYACAGVELGRLDGRGVGLTDAATGTLDWVALVVGPRWRRSLGATTAVVVDADAVVGLDEPQFTFDDGSVLYRPSRLSARVVVGLEFAPAW